jgi:hypothetical protein
MRIKTISIYFTAAALVLACGIAYPQGKAKDQPKKAEEPKKVEQPEKSGETAKAAVAQPADKIPLQVVKTDEFTVSFPTFSKELDKKGRGEIMEVVFEIINNDDKPRDMYVFVLLSWDDIKWKYNAFGTKKLVPDKIVVTNFSPFPENRENFEYDIDGTKQIVKNAKDFKLGLDPDSGQAYHLKDNKLIFRTRHLSPYRMHYRYFNNVCILVYDVEGKLVYRQQYALEGYRHR